MPVFWKSELAVFCDEPNCKGRFEVVADTPRQCVSHVKREGWLYRKSQDDGHIIVRCPQHAYVAADMEEDDGYDNP